MLASVLTACAVTAGGLATEARADPPPGRAYELVSPADQSAIAGVNNEAFPLPGLASANGDRVVYGASSSMGPSPNGPVNPAIFGRRTATGWVSRTAIRSPDGGNTPTELAAHESRSAWMTDAGDEMVFGLFKNLGDDEGASLANYSGSIYRSTDTDAPPTWLSAPNAGVTPMSGAGLMPAAADDTRVLAVASKAPLTADAPSAGTSAVYVRRDGAWQLVSRLPDGTLPVGDVHLANSVGDPMAPHGPASAPSLGMRNQLADNGRFVLFATVQSNSTAQLYVRDLDNDVTRQLAGVGGTGAPINARQLAGVWGAVGQAFPVPAPTIPEGLVAAAEDGPYAYFHARPNLTTPATLWQANLETGTVTSRPALNGPPLGVSPDGRRVLFLQPPASGAIGDWTVRYWDMADPGTSVALGTIPSTGTGQPFGLIRVYRSQDDGQSWVFTSAGSLDPSRPSNDPIATLQLYRWSVGDATPTCLTCEPLDGVARTSGVSLTVQESGSTEIYTAPTAAIGIGDNTQKLAIAQPGHSISDDGRWLLFDSPDQLVAEDTNGVRDVYLWDRDAAPVERLQLVSSGVGPSPSYAIDLDPTGRNAFFSTRDGLVPADKDEAYDVYAARIGGGFPGSPESCVGESCRPPVITDPPRGPIVSNVLTAVPAGPKDGVQQGTPKLRVRSVRTSSQRLTVRVDTPGAGRIRVSGKQVRTTSRTAKRATTYTLRVPLSASAKRQVVRGKTVKVGLRVSFTPSGSKKATRVSSSVSVRKGR